MAWSERQASMLKEMGLRVEVVPSAAPAVERAVSAAVPATVARATPIKSMAPAATGRKSVV